MNLLLINYEYPPIGGGAANATWYIARELYKLGHNVTVLTSSFKDLKGWDKQNGVSVYRCLAIRERRETSNIFEMFGFIVSAAVILPRILIKKRIQGVIAFFSFPCGPLGLLARFLRKIPYVVSLRGGDVPGVDPGIMWIHKLLRPVRRQVLKKSCMVTANSSMMQKAAQSVDPYPVSVIPNGVDVSVFYPDIDEQKKKNQPFQFLYIGRLQPEKNLLFMISQLAEIKKSSTHTFVIKIVGNGPQKRRLIQLANTLEFSENIIWQGWVEKDLLRKYYNKSDYLIMPSLYEGMSNAILEAMACGLPVIASKVGGNMELIQSGKTGYLFDLNDSAQFRNIILKVLGNTELATQMGKVACETIGNKHDWRNVAEKYSICFDRASI